MAYSPFLLLMIAIASKHLCNAERLHEQIYSPIEGAAACFRRLNGTHQAGCASADNGAVGVVHMIKNSSDAEWMVLNGTASSYVTVVSTELFYDVVEIFMSHPSKVAGILIYNNPDLRATSFTQESRCPNEYSSAPSSSCSSTTKGGIVWNEKGTGLLRRDIPFPVFYLPLSNDSTNAIEQIENCYERYNLNKIDQVGKPQCSLQLTSFMFAAVNTQVCLRRSASHLLTVTKVCDPLGDYNVLFSLFPRDKENKDESVTLVTARIDTASLFDGISPGAASSVVGMSALLATARLLARMIPAADAHLYKHNILFTLFNGEAFDYIGSQRVAYDISRGEWPPLAPLNASQIRLHVEVGQIGGSFLTGRDDVSWPLHAYTPKTDTVPSEVTEFLAEISANLNKNNMSLSPEFTNNLPPSSLHSFRRILSNVTQNGDLPEILIADFKDTFNNKFYHSALDDYDNVAFVYHNISMDNNGTFIDTETLVSNGTMKESDPQVKIARLATALARTLYQRVTGSAYTGDVDASAHLVDEMLYCFLKDQGCRLLLAADWGQDGGGGDAGRGEGPPPAPAPLYVSVASHARAAIYARHFASLLTGHHLTVNHTECDALKQTGFDYMWLSGWNHTGVCVQTTVKLSDALSPAFIIQDYDYTSGTYSTWTESVWTQMSARLFVSASGRGAKLAAIFGGVATFVAAVLTYWLHKHAGVVFVDTTASSISNSDAASGILRTVNC